MNISIFGLGYGGDVNETRSITLAKDEIQRTRLLPKLDLSIRNLERIIPFGSNVLTSASLNSSYTKSYSTKGEVGAPNLLSRNMEDAINPSLNLNFKFDVSMSIAVSYSKRTRQQL